MKHALIAALTLSLAQSALAGEAMTRSSDSPMAHGQQPAAAGPVAETQGTVKAIEAARGHITLAHEPVPSLHWPAMTMGFAAEPKLLKGLAVGERVTFKFRLEGRVAHILAIRPAS